KGGCTPLLGSFHRLMIRTWEVALSSRPMRAAGTWVVRTSGDGKQRPTPAPARLEILGSGPERVTQDLRHQVFATHLLEDGYDSRTVQELLGPASVEATTVSTHMLWKGGRGVCGPLDLPRAAPSRPRRRGRLRCSGAGAAPEPGQRREVV